MFIKYIRSKKKKKTLKIYLETQGGCTLTNSILMSSLMLTLWFWNNCELTGEISKDSKQTMGILPSTSSEIELHLAT